VALDRALPSTQNDAPIDAASKAVDKIPGVSARREDYTVGAVAGSQEAMGEATVQGRVEDCQVTGQVVTINEESE
jgi:hypothetical protein